MNGRRDATGFTAARPDRLGWRDADEPCLRLRRFALDPRPALALARRAAEGDPGFSPDALVDQLLLARGVARDDLERHRQPTLRGFMPDPSLFRDMDKAAERLADAVEARRAGHRLRRL